MAALGVGAVRPGTLVVSLGTSGTVFGCSSARPSGVDGVCAFRDATGAFLPLVCTLNCMEVLGEVLKAYGSREEDHDALTAKAADVPADCGGVALVPFLRGERTPALPLSTGALVGLRLGDLANAGLIYRAAINGKHGRRERRQVPRAQANADGLTSTLHTLPP